MIRLSFNLTLMCTRMFSTDFCITHELLACNFTHEMTCKHTRLTQANLVNASIITSIDKSLKTLLNINLTCKLCVMHKPF